MPGAIRTGPGTGDRQQNHSLVPGGALAGTLTAVNPASAQHQIEKLRAWRRPAVRNATIEAAVQQFAARARAADRGLSTVLEAWAACVPGPIAECCRPISLTSGTLEIACDSSPATYEVNRWLQDGGIAELTKRGVTLLKVRLVGSKSPPPRSPRAKPSRSEGAQPHGNAQRRKP